MGLHSEANLFAVGWCGMFSSFGVMIWNLTQDALLLAGTAEGHIGSSLEDSNFNHHGSCIQTQFTPHWWCWHLAPIVVHLCRCQKKTQDQLKSLQSGQTFAFRELSGSQAEQLPVSSACWEMLGNVGKILGTYFQTLTLTGSDRLWPFIFHVNIVTCYFLKGYWSCPGCWESQFQFPAAWFCYVPGVWILVSRVSAVASTVAGFWLKISQARTWTGKDGVLLQCRWVCKGDCQTWWLECESGG